MHNLFKALSISAILGCAWLTSDVSAKPHSEYIRYPGFLDRNSLVEMERHRGLMTELVLRCRRGLAIITYSKVEGLYCGPDHRCSSSLRRTAGQACR